MGTISKEAMDQFDDLVVNVWKEVDSSFEGIDMPELYDCRSKKDVKKVADKHVNDIDWFVGVFLDPNTELTEGSKEMKNKYMEEVRKYFLKHCIIAWEGEKEENIKSMERGEYLSERHIMDVVHHFLYLLDKHESWNDPSLVARYKEMGIDLEKLARVDLTKI